MNPFHSVGILRQRRGPGRILLAGAGLLLLSVPAFSQTPNLARVVPAFGPAAGSNIVIVTGTGFAAGATVTFGGVPATSVAIVNSTSLTAHPPAHSIGPVAVSVSNPGGQSGSLANAYKYLTASGQFGIQYFPIPDGAFTDITAGPDGNLWLLNNGGESLDPWISTSTPCFSLNSLADPLLPTSRGRTGILVRNRSGVHRPHTPSGTATEFSLATVSSPMGTPRVQTAPCGSRKAASTSQGESRRAVRSRNSSSRPSRTGLRSARTVRCGSRDAKALAGLELVCCPAGSSRTSQPPILRSASVRRRSWPAPTATFGSNTPAV